MRTKGRSSLPIMLMIVLMWLGIGCTPSSSAPAASTPSPAEEESVESPTGSQSIVVYTALEEEQIERYLAVFHEEHPDIEVEIVRDSTGLITAQLLAEKDDPKADLVWGTAVTSLLLADSVGLLAPYAPEGLHRIRNEFRDENNTPRWVGIDVWMSAFCINTEELEARELPMPDSWADLTNPVYKDQIVMPNPASSGTGFLSVSAILQLMDEEGGWAYLDALHENVAVYTHSGSKPCRMAGAGEYPIGISFDYRAVSQMAEGDPIEAVFPNEGSGWDVEANALIKKDEIKPAARTFLDWAISEAAMREYAAGFGITAAPINAPIPRGFPENPFAQMIENDFEWAAANRERILEEWLKRYDAKSEPQS